MSVDEARDSNGKQLALDRLAHLITVGEDLQTKVIRKAVERVIVDKLVYPKDTSITVKGKDRVLLFRNPENEEEEGVQVTNHALNQICGVLEIPKIYVNRLLDECVGMPESIRHTLLESLFNKHFQHGVFLDRKRHPAKFLQRSMDGKLHAFLSRSYNRMLGTALMMRPFLEECALAGARPTAAFHDALKTTIQCVQPVIYEPVDGEFVAFGASYVNSDFGAGSLLVCGSVLRIMSGTTSVLESRMKKVHLGALIKDSDIALSQETMVKESQAHASAVRDMVREVFSEKNIEETLELVRFSHEHKISWDKLTGKAKECLGKAELDMLKELLGRTKDGTVDLPPITVNSLGDPEANAWWAAAALGHIATNVVDVERKVSIQELAGNLLK